MGGVTGMHVGLRHDDVFFFKKCPIFKSNGTLLHIERTLFCVCVCVCVIFLRRQLLYFSSALVW